VLKVPRQVTGVASTEADAGGVRKTGGCVDPNAADRIAKAPPFAITY